MKQNSIKKNAIMNVIYTITNMVFPLITYPYVTRILSATGMGKVSFFTSVSNYAVMIGSLGISTYGIRAVAKARDDKGRLSRVATELLILNSMITIIVVVLIALSVPFVDKFGAEPILLIINLLIVVATPFGLTWLYSGLEQYSYITKRNLIFKGISLVLVFLLVKKADDYPIYAALFAFSTIGSYLCNLIYSRKLVRFKISKDLKYRYHFKPMLYLFASILAVSVYTNLDTIMLGFINGDEAVGFYSVASKVKWLLLSAVNAVSAVLLPRLSNYISNNEVEKYNQTLRKSVSFIFLITVPISTYFVAEAGDSIILLGGNGYEPAIICMQFLMPILIISGFSNVTGNQILIPSGRDSYFMKAVVTGAIVDVILNAALMPSLAATGAAIATLIAEMTQMSIQFYYTRKEILKKVNKRSLLNAILGSLIGVCIILTLKKWIHFNALLSLTVTAIVFFGAYFLFLLFVKERYLVDIFSEIKRKFHKRS